MGAKEPNDLNFNSYQFLCFFPVVVICYYIVTPKLRNAWLLVCSWFFYACWDARFLFLLLAATVISYVAAFFVEGKRKTGAFAVALVCLFGLLAYFKYRVFFFNTIFQVLNYLSINVSFNPIHTFVLPVGISFYSFQAVGYLVDVWQGKIRAERQFIAYALYIAFFPQLVAGPIERAGNILSQLHQRIYFEYNRFREAVLILLWGYFLKMVLADRIAIFVDTVYADEASGYRGFYVVVATFLFSMQIYCDFYGYSMIAVGSAKMLGIELMENFNAPYLSANVAEFWRRWHISLSSWFRDYLYIPLGGNKKGTARKYINIIVVFLASGLWHGADWAFVLWGGINGAYQIVFDVWEAAKKRKRAWVVFRERTKFTYILAVIATNILVDFAWLFFRAGSIEKAMELITSMFSVWNPWILVDGNSLYQCGLNRANFLLMLFCIGLLFSVDICNQKGLDVRKWILERNVCFRVLFIPASLMFILIFGIWGMHHDASSFIYFQF